MSASKTALGRMLAPLALTAIAAIGQPATAHAGVLTLTGEGMRQVVLKVERPQGIVLGDAQAALGPSSTYAGYWVANPADASSRGSIDFPVLRSPRNSGNVPPIAEVKLGPGLHRLVFLSDGQAAVRIPVSGMADTTIDAPQPARASVRLTRMPDADLTLRTELRFPFEHQRTDDVFLGLTELGSLPQTVHSRELCVLEPGASSCPAKATTGAAPCPCFTGIGFFPEVIAEGRQTAYIGLTSSDAGSKNYGIFVSVGIRG